MKKTSGRNRNISISNKNVAKESPNNSDLEKIFEIQRIEHAKAKVIQLAWRRTRKLLPWRYAAVAVRMVVKIQKVIRGAIVRKYVALWFKMMTRFATMVQSMCRRYLSNKHIRVVLAHEQEMAIQIQRIIRGKLSRLRCSELKRNLAAKHIQILWRGVVGRSISDKLWINKVVKPIQTASKRFLALKRFKNARKELDMAAILIQNLFRSWVARRKLGVKLFEREMNYRMKSIQVLLAEEEFCNDKLLKLMDRLKKFKLKENAEVAYKDLLSQRDEIYKKENSLIETNRQLENLTPRGYEQGWEEDLTKLKGKLRSEITELKMKLLYEQQDLVYQCDDKLEDCVHEMEQWSKLRECASKWKDEEYEERRNLTYRRDIIHRRKEKKLSIADERRKWKILFYSKNGKPDRRRRPGRPWDKSAFAGKDKITYSNGTGVDLFANIRKELSKQNNKRVDNLDLVDETIKAVTLQTYLQEVNHFEQLLEPILKIMQNNYGAPLDGLPPAQLGFGSEGNKLPMALHTIGALPQNWHKKEEIEENEDDAQTQISSIFPLSEYGQERRKSILKTKRSSSSPSRRTSFKTVSIGSNSSVYSFDENNISKSFPSKLSIQVPKTDMPSTPPSPSLALSPLNKRANKLLLLTNSTNSLSTFAHSKDSPLFQKKLLQPIDSSMISTGNKTSLLSSTSISKFPSQSSKRIKSVSGSKQTRSRSTSNPNELEVIFAKQEEAEKQRKETLVLLANKRNSRKKTLRRGNTIPWDLLDELEGEKKRFENEQAYVEFHKKF
eukprot:gene8716-11777_t